MDEMEWEAWDPRGATAEGDPWVGERMTVVLTTSPCEVHPSTYMIEEVFASLARFANVGRTCRRIVVSDGIKPCGTNRYKSGQVTEEARQLYAHYQSRLRHLCAPSSGSSLAGCELLILEKHHGFSHAVKRGLMRVTTPYVLIGQHDRAFSRPAPLSGALEVLGSEPGVSYLTFPTSSTVRHDTWTKQYNLAPVPRKVGGGLELIPLIQFYDSMHVARTEWYLYRIFGKGRWVNLRTGGFIEDVLGQHMIAVIRSQGMASHAQFETFVVVEADGDGCARRPPCVHHLDGHNKRNATHEGSQYRHRDAHTEWDAVEGGAGGDHWAQGGGDSAGKHHEGLVVEVLAGHGSYTECRYPSNRYPSNNKAAGAE